MRREKSGCVLAGALPSKIPLHFQWINLRNVIFWFNATLFWKNKSYTTGLLRCHKQNITQKTTIFVWRSTFASVNFLDHTLADDFWAPHPHPSVNFLQAMDLFCTFTALSGVKLCSLMHMYRQKPKNAMLVGKVADINLYPIKSCRALELQSANCTHSALQHPQIADLLDRLVN